MKVLIASADRAVSEFMQSSLAALSQFDSEVVGLDALLDRRAALDPQNFDLLVLDAGDGSLLESSAAQDMRRKFSQLPLIIVSDPLTDQLTALEDEERRDAADAEAGRDLRVLVDVELGHLGLALVLVGELIDERSDLLARTTPRRREVDEDGDVGLEDQLVEVDVGRGEGVLACHLGLLPLSR